MDPWSRIADLLAGDAVMALAAFGLLVVRWTVFLFVAPLPAMDQVGGAARAAIGAVLAAATLPGALPVSAGILDPAVAIGLALKETLVGLALGAVVAFVLMAFETAGRLTDLYRGATLAEVLAGWGEERTSPLGAFLPLAAVALLIATGGFLVLVGALVLSVDRFPVDAMPAVLLRPEGYVAGVLGLFGRAWEIGFLLAAPALGVSLLLDVSLGLAARVSPGFEGYFLALPLRAVLGIGALVLSLALLRPHLWSLLRRGLDLIR